MLGGLNSFYLLVDKPEVYGLPPGSDTPMLGLLFVVSAASTSAVLMILLADRWEWNMPGLFDLHRFDAWVIALEFLVLVTLMVSLGWVER
jgi:formate-dependent nitrite reductase membrane component NrfD